MRLVKSLSKIVCEFLKNLKIKVSCALAILKVYAREIKSVCQGDVLASMFIVKLFTIVKIQSRSKCPGEYGWVLNMWNVYTVQQYLALKKGKPVICDNTDEPRGYYAK